MADREQPYDPYIPSGGHAAGSTTAPGGNQRTAQLQAVRTSLRKFINVFGLVQLLQTSI